MSKSIQELDNLTIVHPVIKIWSGQTRLTPADFKLGAGGELPPETFADLGSKRICDPATLKGFHRLKTETRRLLLSYGMPFMNGFAVPKASQDEIYQKLADVKLEFERIKDEFMQSYDLTLEEWIRENPDYEQAIRTGALPRAVVAGRIKCDFQMYRLASSYDGDDTHPATQSLKAQVQGLGDDLLGEVCEEAQQFFTSKLSGRTECRATTQRTLRKIRDKVDGLSFLDAAFGPVVKLLDQTLAGYKANTEKGMIQAPFFWQVMAATLILSDRKRINDYANGNVSVDEMANNFAAPVASDFSSPTLDSGTDSNTTSSNSEIALSPEEKKNLGVTDPVENLFGDLDEFFSNVKADSPSNEMAPDDTPAEENVDSNDVAEVEVSDNASMPEGNEVSETFTVPEFEEVETYSVPELPVMEEDESADAYF